MQPLPHQYEVRVTTTGEAHVEVASPGLDPLLSAPPLEFEGPGTLWSPETMLVAAVADCFALTFKSIAGTSKLKWTALACDAKGTLDRVDGTTRFTAIRMQAQLTLPPGTDVERARRTLEKAEKVCLVGNSLKCPTTLEVEIAFEEPAHV